jgi:hypothetical protein
MGAVVMLDEAHLSDLGSPLHASLGDPVAKPSGNPTSTNLG